MQTITLRDPCWLETFPNRVAPSPNEWIAGLLLRCDEANQWASGLTLAHLRRAHPTKDHGSSTTYMISIPPYILHDLADLLAIPMSTLLSTTYQNEVARIFSISNPSYKRLTLSLKFRVCPQCLAEARILRRTLVLPQIISCPWHEILLVRTCQCGAELRLFSQQALPFTCYACGLDWAMLPRIQASPESLAEQKKYLLNYAFFFSSYGTLPMLERALRHLGVRLREEKGDEAFWQDVLFPKWWGVCPTRPDQYQTACSLSMVVDGLVNFNLSPNDILFSDAPLWGNSGEWSKLYYFAIVKMLSKLENNRTHSYESK